MGIYFFNIHNDNVTDDPEGAVLPDRQAARAYAIIAARSLASETVANGHLGLNHRIEIQDEEHNLVDTVYFWDAVEIRKE